jgi:hypothetical protein
MNWIYFIKPVGLSGPIKIGISVRPEHRRQTLERSSPIRLEIVALIAGDAVLEKRFHAKFFNDHDRCEWFNVTAELISAIAEINDGSFDARDLPEPRMLPRKAKDLSYVTPEWRAQRSLNMKKRAEERARAKSREGYFQHPTRSSDRAA